jgi:hypothetical protein
MDAVKSDVQVLPSEETKKDVKHVEENERKNWRILIYDWLNW